MKVTTMKQPRTIKLLIVGFYISLCEKADELTQHMELFPVFLGYGLKY